jgi:hypothetical protein
MNRLISTTLALAALAATAGCMSAPSNLDLSLTRPTAENKFVVTLQPPAKPAAINQLHSHGLPTRPQVTQELPGGTYVIEGMKFSMTGWWEIKLAIDTPDGADKVTFNTVVSEPGAGR